MARGEPGVLWAPQQPPRRMRCLAGTGAGLPSAETPLGASGSGVTAQVSSRVAMRGVAERGPPEDTVMVQASPSGLAVRVARPAVEGASRMTWVTALARGAR